MKPPVSYPGGKAMLADWIVRLLPEHDAYVEPFFGGGSVLLAKSRSRAELVNDLDGSVVAFWRALRDRPDELAVALAATPYAREELRGAAADREPDDDIERARRFAVRAMQGRNSAGSSDWRFDLSGAANTSLARTWLNLPGRVRAVAARLQGVAIENRPAIEVVALASRGAHPGRVLIYADPPYLGVPSLYTVPFTEADHAEMLDGLIAHPGPVVISGYASDLYADKLAGWDRHERRTHTQRKWATEVLWIRADRSQLRMELSA
jgi:DNA adenine methylase